jgi:predicted ATPase/DNA-binding winged helix-turn-helix (wHTH) protein
VTDRYRFDRFELALAERQLTIAGEPATLGARAFDLLLALIERRDRVVAKSELLDLVWPGLVVEENNLQVQVSTLRKLLGADAIATVAGRGYRFVARLLAEAGGGAAAGAKPAPPPTNLPQPRTRFIGREAALADCARLLATSRLITLSGIGGCGKTRLAQELARQQLDAFADGVWFVDLAPLQDGDRVVAVVAATLGVAEVDGTPLASRLADHVATRRLLVVLDNCEHVIDAVVGVVESMLAASPALHLVATSREAFGIAGEQIYPVRSLALPAADELAAIGDSEAVRIFVDRARLVEPGFALDAGNCAVVAEICRRLDGIALAIELAAARVAVLSVDEIRTRLDDRFRLLTGGGRALPRHQTLQATMNWSYDHLAPPEQELFRRLSVFAGGCTLAAAVHVAAGDDEYAVLALLTALHDKSMLGVEREALAAPRYRMLETVRQYAGERLAESGEGDTIRGRHLRYCVALAEQTEPLFLDARQGEAIASGRAEQENLLAAQGWCEHDPDGAALGLRLAAASWRYWRSSGQLERGRNVARAALDHAGADAALLPKCRLLNGLATLAYYAGRYEESKTLAGQALALGREIGDLPQIAAASVLLTFNPKPDEDPRLIMARYAEIRSIALTLGDGLLLARNLNNLAEWHRNKGHVAEAAAGYEESLAIHRGLKNPGMITVVLCNYARLLLGQGDTVRGRAHLGEAFAVATANGLRGMDEHLLEIGAALAVLRSEPERAARLHGASLTRMRDGGAKRESVDEAFLEPLLAGARATLGAAAFDVAERAGAALKREAALDELSGWLANLPDDL